MKNITSLLIIIILACSCKTGETKNSSPADLAGAWELSAIENREFDKLFSNSVPTIQFDTAALKVMGRNSCNQYSGSYTAENTSISFDGSRMISTKMFCEGGGEKVYMDALVSSNQYRVSSDGATLTLLRDGKTTLTFTKA